MIEKIKNYILLFFQSTFNSYSAVYFSDNKVFALVLIAVTFINPDAGLSGLIAVVTANLLAYVMGYNDVTIRKGYYGFNCLLVGLGFGVIFSPGVPFYILLIFASVFTFFLTVAMEGIIGKYGLPFLSIPFLLSFWLILIASKHYTSLVVSQNGIYALNELYSSGGVEMVNEYHNLTNPDIPFPLIIYFKSLAAIFFQYNQYSVLAGVLIAFGILIYSRIALSLSFIGFFTAYYFYLFIGGNINELSYYYIGFNFILTAIALGGFFIVPSRSSYLWVIVLTPLIAIITSGSSVVFWTFQLSIYSLPFNIMVLLFLYILKFRVKNTLRVEEVAIQQYSPEKNLYARSNSRLRFKNSFYFPITLPFWGEWKVAQGINGKETHKGEWKHAWDFVISNFENKTFADLGIRKEDFYCYSKPILSPADGDVDTVIDYINDNEIGENNINDNWGNTVIIKHSQYLYSKVNHLKRDSIKVKKGDKIKRGDVIANCGNSGRSAEPHVHFQLQSNSLIDAKTIEFPISYYILKTADGFDFRQFEKPRENDIISNVEKNVLLEEAYKFVPGRKFRFNVFDSGKEFTETVEWEVEVDHYNNSYILCKNTRSRAYFSNDGNIHYFSHFEGKKDSLLFYFFMASYKVMMGFYKKLELKDQYPVYFFSNPALKLIQDFIAPFALFIKPCFILKYDHIDNPMTSQWIRLTSRAEVKIGKYVSKVMDFELDIRYDRINGILIRDKNRTITATWADE